MDSFEAVLPKVKCLHKTSPRQEMFMPSSSKGIYHKFTHGAISHMLSGKNVNITLECTTLYSEGSKFLMVIFH